jgi:hypothetical protein
MSEEKKKPKTVTLKPLSSKIGMKIKDKKKEEKDGNSEVE